MKHLILLFSISAFIACKKANKPTIVYPDNVVNSTPTGTCVTKKQIFTGDYVFEEGGNITIQFLHNNCPEEFANTYSVIAIGAVVKPYVTSGTVTAESFTVTSNESVGYCTARNNEFKLLMQLDGSLIISTQKWVGINNRKFTKL